MPDPRESTSVGRSWRPGSCRRRRRCSRADGRHRRWKVPTPTRCSARSRSWCDRRSRAAARPAVGVGCGGPMTRGGETRLAAQHPGVARRSRCAARLAAHTGLPVCVDNDAKALALGEGWVGAARGCARLHRAWSCRPASAAASCCDGRLLDGAERQRRAHRPHHRRARRATMCACGARGCLEAEASGTAIAAHHRPAARRGDAPTVRRAHGHARRPRGRVGREPARPAARGRRGSVALGYGDAVLRGRASRDRRALPARLLARHAHRPRRARRRRPPRSAPPPSPSRQRPRQARR